MTGIAAAATGYAKLGLHVFPLRPRGKQPATEHGKDDASADVGIVTGWFTNGHASGNVGIACAPSGIVVVDIDPRNDGAETFAGLERELGALPRTVTADTGGGGTHYLFRRPKGELRGKLGRGVDLISNGYIVAAPSVHPSGEVYSWRTGLGPNEVRVAELPSTWIAKARPVVAPARLEHSTSTPTDRARDREKRARAYVTKMPPAISGQGGHNATWDAVAAVMIGFDLDAQTTRSIVVEEFNPRCEPPWSDREIDHKIASVAKRCDRPRGYLLADRAEWFNGHRVSHREPPPDCGELDEETYAFAARDDEPETTSKSPSADAKAVRYGVPFVEFAGEEPDDNPADVFDVNGLIVRAEPGMFIGEPKVGKTLSLEDLLIHVAAGRKEWCGVPIHRRCRVLVFLREDSELTTRRRLHQLARGAGIEHWELAEWLWIDARSPLYFDDKNHVAKLKGQLAEVDICAIDSLSTIHNADENSVERMAPVMNLWRDLALGTKTAIPLVHHFRKRGNDAGAGNGHGSVLQRARGSSIIGATTRHAVGIERGPAEHQVAISIESNHEVSLEPFVIQRRFWTDERGRRCITHKRVGSLQNARSAEEAALLDPITLAVIRAAGPDGIGTRDLRKTVIERIAEQRGRGIRPAKVDASATRLADRGEVVKGVSGWRSVS